MMFIGVLWEEFDKEWFPTREEAYYVAHILGNGLDAVSEHISDKVEAEKIAGACANGQALVIAVVKEEKWIAPPKLYDLTTLQRDANRLFGFTAKQTSEYMQSLYEKKLSTPSKQVQAKETEERTRTL